METVYVKPRAGGRIRMPDRNFRPMPAEGATVQRSDFYERLILTGDLIVTTPPPKASAATPTAAPAQPAAHVAPAAQDAPATPAPAPAPHRAPAS
jgi:hypothetical protein